MSYWRNMRKNTQYSAQMKERLWAIYGFPFGTDLVMNNRILRYIPICPPYGGHQQEEQDVEITDQNSILLNVPTGGADQLNADVTNV